MAKKCKKGKSCGNTCISPIKKCVADLTQATSDGIDAIRGIVWDATGTGTRNEIEIQKAQKPIVEAVAKEEASKVLNHNKELQAFLDGNPLVEEWAEAPKKGSVEYKSREKVIKDYFPTYPEKPKEVSKKNWKAITSSILEGEHLGSGAFGKVYAKGEVAVKLGEIMAKEVKIGKIASDLGVGPKIYGYYEKSRNNGVLIQERLKGLTLAKLETLVRINPDQFPDELRAKLVTSAYEAQMKLNSNGIAHSDIHGGNLVALPNGKVRFIDWGLARRDNEEAEEELTNSSGGAAFLFYYDLVGGKQGERPSVDSQLSEEVSNFVREGFKYY
jgi:predicted Ser/Thr protein kinase